LRDARAVEAAGAFAIVLEALPRELAAEITRSVRIPTIELARDRIATGRSWCCTTCWADVPGPPKFARQYANVGQTILEAVKGYCADVQSGNFPSDAESYHSSASVKGGRPSHPRGESSGGT